MLHPTLQLHACSWQMLAEEGNHLKKLCPANLNENLLIRLETVVEGIYKTIRHISIASDGSRHGCKDANYMILGGYDKDRYRVHCGVMVKGSPI